MEEGAPSSRIEGVLFLPSTSNSRMAKRLQQEDDKFAKTHGVPRIRVVERGGSKLRDLVTSSNPWKKEHCGRTDCFLCNSKGEKSESSKGMCQREGVVYKVVCRECESKGVKAAYIGESSRTAYLRGGNHQQDMKTGKEDNPMVKHTQEHHQGIMIEDMYRMEILRNHRGAFSRQIHEAVKIMKSNDDIQMNSKAEYNGVRIPRISV